jgi:hypothetical protein
VFSSKDGLSMPAFDRLEWARFDVNAIVSHEGLVVVTPVHRVDCHAWLQRHDYSLTSIDFAKGIDPAEVALCERLRWEAQFGYRPTPGSRNLDALRDGFDFDLKPGQGHVLELLNPEVAHREDQRWLTGLLAIAHEYSRNQLALGARFFTMLILERESPLIGLTYESLRIAGPFWNASRKENPFA